MNKTTDFWSRRAYFLMGLFLVYYLFIGLILSILFSTNPKELVQQLWHHQWPQYLFCLGLGSGFYFSLSSCATLVTMADFYRNNKSYRNFFLTCMELIVQLIWIFLPIELIKNGNVLSNLNPAVVTGCISFAVSLATFRRLRINTINEKMKFLQAF